MYIFRPIIHKRCTRAIGKAPLWEKHDLLQVFQNDETIMNTILEGGWDHFFPLFKLMMSLMLSYKPPKKVLEAQKV